MPMNLGQIIDLLRAMPQDDSVFFDFGDMEPTTLDSYRGYYDHLAIGFEENCHLSHPAKVSGLLAGCEAAVGQTYQGWKGGDYCMDRATPVWVANRGKSSSTAIVGIREVGYGVVIDTRFDEAF